MRDPLREAATAGLLRALDARFAEFLLTLDAGTPPAVRLAAALASQQLGEGHICLDLAAFAGRRVLADPGQDVAGTDTPTLDAWRETLTTASVMQTPGGGPAPLVLDGDRLYLRRYWCFEQHLAARLHALSGQEAPVDDPLLTDGLQRLFGDPGSGVDWQRVAAAVAVLRPFAVVSGGPGTGKTHTVSRVLALLAEQGLAAGAAPRIRLAAPTGKAAARLTESIAATLPTPERLRDPAVLEAIPREAVTLHRLLRARPGRLRFGHNADNPLHLDVLLVDEASMVDLPLMARLVEALPPRARLILLGDKDQLASVEAGAVLGDLCAGADGYTPAMRERLAAVTGQRLPDIGAAGPLADGITFLHRSRRFRDEGDGPPGIGRLARLIRDGEGEATVALLREVGEGGAHGELAFRAMDTAGLRGALAEQALPRYRAITEATEVHDAFAALERFRILTALREGPFGAGGINRMIRELLGPLARGRWYHGQPVMVTHNDYALGLYNGDIGLVWETGQGLRAHFPAPDSGLRDFAPQRLPAHQTVYAMTVHKSQGSEFQRLLLVLPDEPSPVLTRELLYTGLTRAREHATIWGRPGVIRETVRDRPTRRASGLASAVAALGR
ncbi:exodeoxyribonuclease V subunit alpha [Arhodomonas sp. SL1]|uniref:exodeoxyribonuclease V subunit alpha n=1 Tax=Arhodomonas sp. SL1 TaxID=3425691 RepID=UPI003F8845E4